MRPRTLEVPKAMLRVAGRPFIDWQLERIAECGYHEVVLCIGYLGEQLRQHVGEAHSGMRVRYSEDGPRLLGTAGALRRALPSLRPCFLVTYGDSYLPFDYAAPLRDLEAHPEALGTMSVYQNQGRYDASNTQVLGEKVVRYEKGASDPALDHIDYGATALRRSVVEGVPEDTVVDLSQLQQRLAADGRLRAYTARERFYEIGSEDGLRELERKLSKT